jgi:hypothetical protein
MRIDGLTSSYPLDRSSRTSTAVTPYREVQREVEERREQPAAPSATQGFEQTPQQRRVQANNAGSENLPARTLSYSSQDAPLNRRAAQALASYGNTASYVSDLDAPEVLGLDLYA